MKTVFCVRANEFVTLSGTKEFVSPKKLVLGEEDGAIESDKLSAGEKQMLSFLVLQYIQRKRSYFH